MDQPKQKKGVDRQRHHWWFTLYLLRWSFDNPSEYIQLEKCPFFLHPVENSKTQLTVLIRVARSAEAIFSFVFLWQNWKSSGRTAVLEEKEIGFNYIRTYSRITCYVMNLLRLTHDFILLREWKKNLCLRKWN